MKMKMYVLLLVVLSFVFGTEVKAQHNISISAKFSQIQEGLNGGMVFSGPEIFIKYGYTDIDPNNALILNSGFSVGILFNRGIIGVATKITPIDIFYGFKMDVAKNVRFYLGPRLITNYNVQLYPDLQSGLDFWVTNINISPNAMLEIPYDEDLIRVQFSTSVLGLLSRTPEKRDPYFFSLNIGDIISDLHSDLEFGTFDKFLHTTISAEYCFGNTKKWTLGYGLDYFQYFDEPDLKMLNHSLHMKYNFGGK